MCQLLTFDYSFFSFTSFHLKRVLNLFEWSLETGIWFKIQAYEYSLVSKNLIKDSSISNSSFTPRFFSIFALSFFFFFWNFAPICLTLCAIFAFHNSNHLKFRPSKKKKVVYHPRFSTKFGRADGFYFYFLYIVYVGCVSNPAARYVTVGVAVYCTWRRRWRAVLGLQPTRGLHWLRSRLNKST